LHFSQEQKEIFCGLDTRKNARENVLDLVTRHAMKKRGW